MDSKLMDSAVAAIQDKHPDFAAALTGGLQLRSIRPVGEGIYEVRYLIGSAYDVFAAFARKSKMCGRTRTLHFTIDG